MTARFRQKCLFKCFLSVLPLVVSCTKPPLTDDDLIASFQRNRSLFKELAFASPALDRDCTSKDSSICVPKASQGLENKLKSQLHLPILDFYIKRDLGDSLWIPVQTYGPMSMSSSGRGYVYCKCSLGPLTGDTIEALGKGANGVWYRPIEDGWMLFAVR